MNPVVITALGLVSSVGRRANDSCAAIRAGIARPTSVRHFSVLEGEEYEVVPLKGHPIAGLTDGQGPAARWLVMCERAVRDLLAALPARAPGLVADRWGAVLVLPVLNDARFFYAPECRPEKIWNDMLSVLVRETGMPIVSSRCELVTIGSAGVGVAVEQARSWLDAGEVDRVLVLAVDSLIDASSLAWLASGHRLKEPSNPVGLAPGEAAVALLLDRQSAEPSPLGALLSIVALEDADLPFFVAERCQGRPLAAALTKARDLSGGPLAGDVYSDLNGETWRAAELGSALATVSQGGILAQYRLHTPAASVGDTGVASAAVGIACAAHAFARGYNAGPRSWVLSSSDYGEVGVICVEGDSRNG